MTFNELNIVEPILRAIIEKGYDQPTPIQQQAIPVVLSGKDIFGIAQTGTGKTAAFAVPILQKLTIENQKNSASDGQTSSRNDSSDVVASQPAEDKSRRQVSKKPKRVIRALVLTPTRELAIQISECFADYGKYTGLKHTAIFGGVKQRAQTDILHSGVDVLIATPGRLLDLISQKEVRLDSIDCLVLDEADRMLDMGFIADIRKLLAVLPKVRQTLFFSATLPDDIVALSRSILNKPVRIEVTPASSTVDSVEQSVYFVEKPEKKGLLISILRKDTAQSVLIFARTKHGADNISKILKKAGIHSEAIHGDKSQGQRQKALGDFKSGKVKVMVATDIAARGIDIKELQMVINYDLPDVPETYVHRIGRTGRAGCTGKAVTFCSQEDHMKIHDIQKLVGKKLEAVLYTA